MEIFLHQKPGSSGYLPWESLCSVTNIRVSCTAQSSWLNYFLRLSLTHFPFCFFIVHQEFLSCLISFPATALALPFLCLPSASGWLSHYLILTSKSCSMTSSVGKCQEHPMLPSVPSPPALLNSLLTD